MSEPVVTMFFSEDSRENTDSNGSTEQLIINPKNLITLPIVPTYYTFSLSVIISKLDFTQFNSISIQLKIGDHVVQTMDEFQLPPTPEGTKTFNFGVGFRNLEIMQYGKYEAILKINGTEYCRTPIIFEGA